MRSCVAIRALGAGLGVLFLVGSAKAGVGFTNFDECLDPAAVPTAVMGTILADGAFGFGTLSEKVCNGIVKKDVSLCKSQVKLARKCNDKTLNSLNDTLLKQCAQLTDATDRADCKDGVKADVKGAKDDNKTNRDTGVTDCETGFADNLLDNCINGVPM